MTDAEQWLAANRLPRPLHRIGCGCCWSGPPGPRAKSRPRALRPMSRRLAQRAAGGRGRAASAGSGRACPLAGRGGADPRSWNSRHRPRPPSHRVAGGDHGATLGRTAARVTGISTRSPQPPSVGCRHVDPPPALERIAQVFGLTPFERNVLLLCVARALDTRFGQLLQAAHGSPWPSFGLAMALFPDPVWDVLAPDVRCGAGGSWKSPVRSEVMTAAGLNADERVVRGQGPGPPRRAALAAGRAGSRCGPQPPAAQLPWSTPWSPSWRPRPASSADLGPARGARARRRGRRSPQPWRPRSTSISTGSRFDTSRPHGTRSTWSPGSGTGKPSCPRSRCCSTKATGLTRRAGTPPCSTFLNRTGGLV